MLILKMLCKAPLIFLLTLSLKFFLVFLLLVFVRVTTPRLKFENLTKLGWLYSLSYLTLTFLLFTLGVIATF